MNQNKTLKSEEDWKKELNEAQYTILRKKGTERPHTGQYNMHFENGIYHCAGCKSPLFKSQTKFDAGCGWPSFTKPVEASYLNEISDTTHGMIRTEVRSTNGDSHLGHVFPDGPKDRGGLRYCINSASLRFVHVDDMEAEGYGKYVALMGE